MIIKSLKEKYPNIQGPRKKDICYATQNRQEAVKALAKKCDLIFVVGSTISSNSNRLREIASKHEVPAYLIDGPHHIKQEWFNKNSTIGITAGASAPEILVQQVIDYLKTFGPCQVDSIGDPNEGVYFPIPKELSVN